MNCVELQESLAEIEDCRAEKLAHLQREHLKNCPTCSVLVEELCRIAYAAAELRSSSEPSPRVWNSIEIALRQEGLIRPQRPSYSLLPSFHTPAWVRWMVPVAAILLLSVGIYLRRHSPAQQIVDVPPAVSDLQADAQLAGLNDNDLIEEMAQQPPAVQAQYTDNLRRVNQYIQDAKNVVAANPNDEDAHRSLMEACQQKAMLFELAMDRSMQ
jgi:hypothetical protein